MSSEDFYSLTHVSEVLTNDRLSEGLSKWFKEDVAFSHWEYVGELGKGDFYLSELKRIRIFGKTNNGTQQCLQVILKTIPKSISRRLTFRSDEFFRNEINFYEICLPALLEFQLSKNVEPFNKYAKLFLSYCDGVNDFLILEDLGLYDFTAAVRQEGIDLEHSKVTLEALAQFHALSFAMKDQQPERFDKIRHAVFETYYDDCHWSWYERFFKRICKIAIDAVEKEYPNSVYVDKIKQFAVPERYKDMIKAVKTYETGVISHGDSWTNNFLYKYKNEKPVDARIIDFQLTRCASPVLDVTFMIYACTEKELRGAHYDYLMDYYYKVLSEYIRVMGSDPDKVYSKEKFLEEIKEHSFFGLAFSFESTPSIVLEPDDGIDMEMKGDQKINIDDVWTVGPFKTKAGRQREANNIVHCVNRGYI